MSLSTFRLPGTALFALAAAAFAAPALAQTSPATPAPASSAPSTPAATAPASTAPATAPAAASTDPVVARINGTQEIHKSDLLAAQKQLPDQYQALPLEKIYPQLLDQVVANKVVLDAAQKAKVDESDAEVKDRLAHARDVIIANTYMERATKDATSDKALHDAYDKAIKSVPPSEELHARQILVKSEAEAKAIIAKLQKGADFAKLANEQDPTDKNGGDLGWFTKDSMVPEFGNAADKLKKGEYTKTPVKSKFGYHIIKLEDRRTKQPPSFDEVKAGLADQVKQQAVQDKIQSLKTDAKVEEFNLDGTPLVPAKP